ncbi:hypothetical protein [Anoxynatronum sibiricum]|uniref:Uncharacterized protein n=1 Tax=Anoxynatronum sibiricum TaxID=210623 RepID=A0ABU9VVX4_9CLOT
MPNNKALKQSPKEVFFHVDVNSTYLSWEVVDRLQHGAKEDLRDVTAVVGGDDACQEQQGCEEQFDNFNSVSEIHFESLREKPYCQRSTQ